MLAYSGVVQFVLVMFHGLERAHTQGGVLPVVVGVDKFSQHVFALTVCDPFPSVGPGKIMPYHFFQGTVKPLHHSGFDIPVVLNPYLPANSLTCVLKNSLPSSVCR